MSNEQRLTVAVYGSLRVGMGNHRVMGDDSILLSTETIKDNFDMIDMGSFPGLIPSEEQKDIVVEVYSVTPRTYANIERLEGYPSFYNRRDVNTSHGPAGIYFLERSGWGSSKMVQQFDSAYDWVKHCTEKWR